jgi:hypothetical protein
MMERRANLGDYIREMAGNLAQMAHADGLDALAYVLEIATLEANLCAQEQRKEAIRAVSDGLCNGAELNPPSACAGHASFSP